MRSKKDQIRQQATPGCPWAVVRGTRNRAGVTTWRVLSCHRLKRTGTEALGSRYGGRGRHELYNVNSAKTAEGFGKV